MVHALVSVLVLAVAVLLVSRFLPGVKCKGFKTAVLVALGLSLVNFVVWKVLFFLAIPFLFLTGFLGYFIISAAALWAVDQVVEDFEVDGVGTLLMASGAIALVNWVLTVLVPGI
jgi:putative membrane protein